MRLIFLLIPCFRASVTAMSPSCGASFPVQRGLHESWHFAPEAHVVCVVTALPSCSAHSRTFSPSGAQFQGKQSSECPGLFSMLLRKIGVFRTGELCWYTVCCTQCHFQRKISRSASELHDLVWQASNRRPYFLPWVIFL